MKKRVNFWIDNELWNFAKWYARQNSTNATQMIRDYFVRLRRSAKERGEYNEYQINSGQTKAE